MMVLDVDFFLQDLAVQPADTATRRVYSDALRDLGREAEADRQLAIAAAIEEIPEPYQGVCARILHRGIGSRRLVMAIGVRLAPG